MDDLAAMRSPVHDLHPLAKLLSTISYILLVLSFGKYALSALVVMLLWPLLLFALSGVSVGRCFYKLRLMMLLVCAMGAFNPLFDRTIALYLGTLAVSGGVLSMLTLMLKGVLCLMAAFLLAATTPLDALCAALRKLRVPSAAVTLLLLTYRYVGVMMEEVAVMNRAYRLRAPGQRGIRFQAWGSFLGQLLLRSMDRGSALYAGMQLRGFDGEFRYAPLRAWRRGDTLFLLLSAALLLFFRLGNVTELLGRLVMG